MSLGRLHDSGASGLLVLFDFRLRGSGGRGNMIGEGSREGGTADG